MLDFIMQPLRVFLNGVLGKDRREKNKLAERLRIERTEHDRLAEEQARLIQAQDQLLQERDRLSAQYETAVAEHAQSKTECDRIKSECDRLAKEYAQLEERHAQLQQSYHQLKQQNIELEQQHQTIKQQLATVNEEKQAIEQEVEDLRVAAENLRKNNNGYVAIADENIRKLTAQLSDERNNSDDLRRAKTSLEFKLEYYLRKHAQVVNADKSEANKDKSTATNYEPEELHKLDLSHFSIAIVGGHSNLRRRVIERLKNHHHVRKNHLHELSAEHSSDHSTVKSKIQHCDFTFIITDSISHKLNNSVMDLRNKHSLEGKVIRLDKSGFPSVMSKILSHIADHMD